MEEQEKNEIENVKMEEELKIENIEKKSPSQRKLDNKRKRKEKMDESFKKRRTKEKEARETIRDEKKKLEDEKISKMTPGRLTIPFIHPEEFLEYKKMKNEQHNLQITERRNQKKEKEEKMENIMKCPNSECVTVCVDCDYDDLMNESEIKSLSQQIMFIYARNCKEEQPFKLILSGVGPKLQSAFDKLAGVDKWKLIYSSKKDFREIVDEKTTCIYLSSESDKNLETLEKGKCYIIGGLVDKNRHKGKNSFTFIFRCFS
jgi:tRNA (guanine9-N1)-methyltransferase